MQNGAVRYMQNGAVRRRPCTAGLTTRPNRWFLIDVYVVAGSTGRTILSAVHELIEVYLRVSFPSLPVF